jgi:hypothetical protein
MDGAAGRRRPAACGAPAGRARPGYRVPGRCGLSPIAPRPDVTAPGRPCPSPSNIAAGDGGAPGVASRWPRLLAPARYAAQISPRATLYPAAGRDSAVPRGRMGTVPGGGDSTIAPGDICASRHEEDAAHHPAWSFTRAGQHRTMPARSARGRIQGSPALAPSMTPLQWATRGRDAAMACSMAAARRSPPGRPTRGVTECIPVVSIQFGSIPDAVRTIGTPGWRSRRPSIRR